MKTGNKHQQPSRFTQTHEGMIRTCKGKYVSYEEYMLLFNAYQHQIQKCKKAGERITAMQEPKDFFEPEIDKFTQLPSSKTYPLSPTTFQLQAS